MLTWARLKNSDSSDTFWFRIIDILKFTTLDMSVGDVLHLFHPSEVCRLADLRASHPTNEWPPSWTDDMVRVCVEWIFFYSSSIL